MAAVVLGQIPDPDTATAITAYDLALVGMDHDVIGRAAMVIASLDGTRSCLPDLDCAVLGGRNHPLALAMEGDSSDIASVTLERQQRVWVRRFDVVKFHGVVAGGSQEALIGGDAEAIDLRVRVLNRTRADPRECLPESRRAPVSCRS